MTNEPGNLPIEKVPLGWEPVNECTRDGEACRALLGDLAGRRNAALVTHPDGTFQVWEERNPIWRD